MKQKFSKLLYHIHAGVFFLIVILICETEQFCLEGSKVEVDFRTVLFGFAFLLVVSFPLDLFASGGKIRKVKKWGNSKMKHVDFFFECSNYETFVTQKDQQKKKTRVKCHKLLAWLTSQFSNASMAILSLSSLMYRSSSALFFTILCSVASFPWITFFFFSDLQQKEANKITVMRHFPTSWISCVEAEGFDPKTTFYVCNLYYYCLFKHNTTCVELSCLEVCFRWVFSKVI